MNMLTRDAQTVLDVLELRQSKTVVSLIQETGIPMTRMRVALSELDGKELAKRHGLIGWSAL